jgi:hypothetical protein
VTETSTQDRLALKTPEAAFLHVLRAEFDFSLRVSHELLSTAKEMLVGSAPSEAVRPGQVRAVVASLKAPFGPPLAETAQVEVTLTIEDGSEDAEVKAREGNEGLRRGRILRITEEALEQRGVLSQEGVARALGVSARTIRRDVRALKAAGHVVQTRGYVKGVGRGQTRKVAQERDRGRLARLVQAAEAQGGLLTIAELSVLLNKSYEVTRRYAREWEEETGKLLPLKGYRMDQGSRPTHKREIVRVCERGVERPDVDRETGHSLKSVERYLQDYERVRMLLQQGMSAQEISSVIGRGLRVVLEYVELARRYHPELFNETD